MISEATLREIGVEDILMFYADSNEFDSVRDAEEELKKEYENAIVSVIKTKKGYFCMVFVPKTDLNEYLMLVLEAFIRLDSLAVLAEVTDDKDIAYLASNTRVAVARLMDYIGCLFKNVSSQ